MFLELPLAVSTNIIIPNSLRICMPTSLCLCPTLCMSIVLLCMCVQFFLYMSTLSVYPSYSCVCMPNSPCVYPTLPMYCQPPSVLPTSFCMYVYLFSFSYIPKFPYVCVSNLLLYVFPTSFCVCPTLPLCVCPTFPVYVYPNLFVCVCPTLYVCPTLFVHICPSLPMYCLSPSDYVCPILFVYYQTLLFMLKPFLSMSLPLLIFVKME